MRTNIRDISFKQLPGNITIIPVESHYSKRSKSNGFCQRKWHSLLEKVASEPNTYLVFPGDAIDSDRPSMRARKANMYAESERESAREEIDNENRFYLEKTICKDLMPIKDKILGMVDGDHFVLYQNGLTSTQHICHTLGIPNAYIGRRMGWVTLRIKKEKSSKRTSFDIFVRHGKGGTSSIGADVNALLNQSTGFLARLYVGGHTHKRWFYTKPFLYPDSTGHIKQQAIGWARAGSLLKGFIPGETTYAEECEYSPLDIGWPEIYLKFAVDEKDCLALRSMRGLS